MKRTIRKLGIVALALACSGCMWTRYMMELQRQNREHRRLIREDAARRPQEDPCLCIWPDDACSDERPSVCRAYGGCVDSCLVTCAEVDGADSVTFSECRIKEGIGAT